MKMPEWLDKEQDEKAETRAKRCWPGTTWRQVETRCDFKEGFISCFELMAAEILELRAALKYLAEHIDDDGDYARKALEKTERWEE